MDRISQMKAASVATEARLDDTTLALTQAMNALSQSRSRMKQLKLAIKRADRNLRDTRLLAPFSGVLSSVDVGVGKVISSTTPLGVITDINNLEVSFVVPAEVYAEAGQLKGDSVTVIWKAGGRSVLSVRGKIIRSEPVFHRGDINQIAAIVFMVPLAIGQASTIRVGHEAGAGRRQDTIRAGVTPVVLTISVCLVQSVLIIGFAEASIRAFLNPDDASIYAVVMLAMPMLMVVAFFQVFDGLQVVLSCVLRGLNDTKIPAVISIMAYWGVGATMAVALSTPLGFGPVGVWWGLLLGLVAGSIMLGWRGVLTYWRITRGKRLLMA